MITPQLAVRITAAGNTGKTTGLLSWLLDFQGRIVNSSPAAGNKSSRDILFQRAPRCGWHRAGLPWRLRARIPEGKQRRAERWCEFSIPAADASDRAPRQFLESRQASGRRVCPHPQGLNMQDRK